MTRYLCALCGTPLKAEEVEAHFTIIHPDHPPPGGSEGRAPLRLLHSGLLIPARNGRPAAGFHTCSLCGFKARFYTVATIHVLIEHPAAARAHLPQGETSLRRAFTYLIRAGIINPAGLKRERRGENGVEVKGSRSRSDDLERGVERVVASLLSRHLGRSARLLASTIAKSVAGERVWRRYGPLLSSRVSTLFSRWLSEERVVVDDLGRRWLLRAATGGAGRPRAALFARLD